VCTLKSGAVLSGDVARVQRSTRIIVATAVVVSSLAAYAAPAHAHRLTHDAAVRKARSATRAIAAQLDGLAYAEVTACRRASRHRFRCTSMFTYHDATECTLRLLIHNRSESSRRLT